MFIAKTAKNAESLGAAHTSNTINAIKYIVSLER